VFIIANIPPLVHHRDFVYRLAQLTLPLVRFVVEPTRRTFLGLVGLGAAALAGGDLLAGCSKQAGSKGTATGADAIKSVLPVYKPLTVAKPDLPGTGAIPNGYLKYPSDLVQQIPQ
jgi:putative aldouronate transport system substrate-binding protein